MGIIGSLFKKKLTTKEQLEKIQSNIEYLEEYKWSTIRSQKNTIGLLFFISAFVFIITAFVLYFHYLPLSSTWKEKLICALPLIVFPTMVYVFKRCLQWYYRWDLDSKTDKLIELKRQKKKILDKVMETETYKVAKEILEKYEPSSLVREKESSSFTTVNRSPLNTSANINNNSFNLRHRNTPLQNARLMNQSQILPPSKRSNLVTSPASMLAQGAVLPPKTRPMLAPMLNISGLPQPRLVRPIPSQDRGVVEKLVDYVVGDGPTNRYALICNVCKSHNGMALKDEFEYIAYRCCYCFSLNPARKQRPFAPIKADLMIEGATKRDSIQPVVDEPESDNETKQNSNKEDENIKSSVNIVDVSNEMSSLHPSAPSSPSKIRSSLPDTSVFDDCKNSNDNDEGNLSSDSSIGIIDGKEELVLM